MIEWIRDEDCAVALDGRMHPVMISSWYGTATVRVVDDYYRWNDSTTAAALADEQRLIRIADLSQARPPAAAVRKRAFEHVRNGVLKPSAIVTHRIPLDEIAEGYHLMSNKLDGCIKPLVIPTAH